jgi:uncharacterized protein DUF397
MTPNMTDATWRKSSYSGSSGGQCVEVAELPGIVAVRDSKDKNGPALTFSPEMFGAFTKAVKAGQL